MDKVLWVMRKKRSSIFHLYDRGKTLCGVSIPGWALPFDRYTMGNSQDDLPICRRCLKKESVRPGVNGKAF